MKIQTIEIDYTVLVPRMSGAQNGAAVPVLEFAAIAYDVDGRMMNSILQRSAGAAEQDDPGVGPKGLYRVQQQLDVPASARSLRIAVRETTTNRVGTMEIPLPLAAVPATQASAPGGPTNGQGVSATKPN
jgi:hypothetical protein